MGHFRRMYRGDKERYSMSKKSQKIKLVVVDIDGTLLNPLSQLSPRTIEAIRKAQNKGVKITLATARSYRDTANIASELELDMPLIVCDGALIIKHPQKNILRMQTIEAIIAQNSVKIIASHNIQPIVHHVNKGEEEVWTGPALFDNQWILPYFKDYPHMRRLPHYSLCTGQPDPLRVFAFSSLEKIRSLASEISTLTCSWHIIKNGYYGCAELAILNSSCSKASALLFLASQMAFSPEEIMAIGDNNNDIEMLKAVEWGIAMGHAPETVKSAAKAITATNAEDGVALAIEHYIL